MNRMKNTLTPAQISNIAEKRIRKFFIKYPVPYEEVSWLVSWLKPEIRKAIRDERKGKHYKFKK